MNYSLKPVRPADEAFLYRLYLSTRSGEVAQWGWPEAQQEMFLKMQFQAQLRHYRAVYPDAQDSLVYPVPADLKAEPAGRLLVARAPGEIRLVDIALLTEWRGKGLGSAIIKTLIEEASRSASTIYLSVTVENRAAAKLYRRLGFEENTSDGIYIGMQWKNQ
ncbi:MAG TPA: GNAT family N-acetyltransferase [Chloroflexia bacterium]|nr:GNAT family N-acetyltransferase [Chloroflexia bacterium]